MGGNLIYIEICSTSVISDQLILGGHARRCHPALGPAFHMQIHMPPFLLLCIRGTPSHCLNTLFKVHPYVLLHFKFVGACCNRACCPVSGPYRLRHSLRFDSSRFISLSESLSSNSISHLFIHFYLNLFLCFPDK